MAQGKRPTKRGRSKKRKNKRKDETRIVLLFLILLLIVLIIAVALFYTKHRMRSVDSPQVKLPEVTPETYLKKPLKREEEKTQDILKRKGEYHRTYQVAIIIDDLGYNIDQAEKILQIDAPLTISIFPLGTYSKFIAEKAHSLGKEVMLHLPMEPYRYPEKNPGNGGLLLSMSNEELLEKLDENIESVPFIKGVNNHMGSRFTEDREKMRIVLMELKRRNLFFVDSRTTNNSAGYSLAKDMGLNVAGRNIFLDNVEDVELISVQLNKLANVSFRNGSAVGIGHPHPTTIEALTQMIPKLKAQGIEVVPISQLVD
ncbi:MAG: divergent polysaccharide deacetylase family protein [Thermodesulfobacteriota bacterium]|nr:divergent polysaccharide deacetylase family protein [Thermodesulfobacteriota bacterium]